MPCKIAVKNNPTFKRKNKIVKNAIQIAKALFILLFMLSIIGCGKASYTVLVNPDNISSYENIYVADVSVSSKEQSENAKKVNEEMITFTKDELLKAIKQKGSYNIIENAESCSNCLILETNIEIVYGSRALRYIVGMGAGSGSCKINMKLTDPSSGQVKYETKSKSKLAGGAFGGSMDATVKNNIIGTVKQFVDRM